MRAALTPLWVVMAEAELPQSWTDARNVILANSPWMLLLVAFERAFEGYYIQAGCAFALCLVALAVRAALVPMLVLCVAAHVGFIDFDDAQHLHRGDNHGWRHGLRRSM